MIQSIVVNYVSNNVLANSPLCISSDDLEYHVSFCYKVLHEIVVYIKEVNPIITKIHYFSNGCPAQYKNCKHFFNLCHHKNDFSVDCILNFFASFFTMVSYPVMGYCEKANNSTSKFTTSSYWPNSFCKWYDEILWGVN